MKAASGKHQQWTRIAVRTIVTVAAAVGLWLLLKFLLPLNLHLFDPFNEALDNYQLTDLYFNIHRTFTKTDIQDAAATDIVTIDIADLRTRSEVAELLQRVADAEPKIVALDVIFGDATAVTSTENDSLVSALCRLPNLVAATNMVPGTDTTFFVERSFFAEAEWVTEASSNLQYGVVRYFSPLLVFGTDTLTSFAKQIADMAGISMPATTDYQLIDYTLAEGICLNATEQWDAGYLKEKIVLIGDRRDLRDRFTIPVTLHGETSIPGIDIHRQILATASSGHLFHKTPRWIEVMTIILIMLITALICNIIRVFGIRSNHLSDTAIDWLIFIMQLCFILPTLIVAYALMWGCHMLFGVEELLVFFGLYEFIDKLLYNIYKWITGHLSLRRELNTETIDTTNNNE
ncbi:MAG: CHASE2 domain-containing protein [Paludibacteraceae bacterium]|nr:CHASE2 domain-containing protein [Paludibacteraceae bacterium]